MGVAREAVSYLSGLEIGLEIFPMNLPSLVFPVLLLAVYISKCFVRVRACDEFMCACLCSFRTQGANVRVCDTVR